MAWTIAIWDDADWSAAAILNEFVDAVNEREEAVGLGAPLAAVNIGDDVQAATFFQQFQQYVEDRLGCFVVSHDAGVPRAADYYDGAGAFDTYADLAAVFLATDLAHADWRRYTTHPDDGGVVAFGQVQPGDIIGPWIFEDLQKALNVLIWTWAVADDASLGEDNAKYAVGNSFAPGATEAAAKAAAAAAYAAGAAFNSDGYARAGSETRFDADTGAWKALLWRRYTYLVYDRGGAPVPSARDVQFYHGVELGYADEFDRNGDFGAGYAANTLVLFDTVPGTVAGSVTSVRFGQLPLPQPNWSPNAGPVARGYNLMYAWPAMQVIEQWVNFVYK